MSCPTLCPQLFGVAGVATAIEGQSVAHRFITSRGMRKMSPGALSREEINLPGLKVSRRR